MMSKRELDLTDSLADTLVKHGYTVEYSSESIIAYIEYKWMKLVTRKKHKIFIGIIDDSIMVYAMIPSGSNIRDYGVVHEWCISNNVHMTRM